MRKFSGFFSLVFAAVLGAFLANAGQSVGSAISLLTGPQPAADLVSIVNGLINNINTKVGAAGVGNVSESVTVSGCSGCVDLVSLSGGASYTSSTTVSNVATVGTYGPATSVALGINPQGVSGFVRFLNTGNLLASNAGSVPAGFAGANTIRQWLIVENSGGISRLLPLYGYSNGP